MKTKSIAKIREKLPHIFRHGTKRQNNKLMKAYHGKRINQWWEAYANAEGLTISQQKEFEGCSRHMKGGHHHRRNYSQCIQCAKLFRKNKGEHNCRHRTNYIYYRFKTKSVNDPRPLKVLKPLGTPYWVSGYEHDGNFELVAAIIVCYLPTGTNLTEYWDDAYDIETTPCNVIKYTSRFPKPDWLE